MAAASLRRVGKGLLLSPIFRKPSLPSGSAILSDVFVPMGVCSILTETSLKIQSAQVYPHDLWQSFPAVIRGYSSFSIASLRRAFSSNVNQLPVITDPDIEGALKDLLAINWDVIPKTVVNETKMALSKATEDKAAQEVLANVFRAAEASVEFSGVLVSLRMALDDLCGLSGENVGHLPEHLEDAIRAAYKRYITYLDSFDPDETFLRKKVELELGTKMIHLKMRCSGIGSEWGKVTLLGTSGLSGSYVELRS
ncbi:succinate dehydrogenase subunit 5, mitochondrial-like [Curcuma longa]|uniref:succinate dehydrogenase subunit 5, mitochondrial-like n=1 Tax=Curcuma longa TaxID=136217 RepID=UPI003D9ECB90